MLWHALMSWEALWRRGDVVGKSGGSWEKWEKWEKVVKNGEKWRKVGKSGEKVGKS